MQYVTQGVALGSASRERLTTALQGDCLRQIGKVMALDVLVNNCDRFPLIRSHQGNAGNLMLNASDEAVSIGL